MRRILPNREVSTVIIFSALNVAGGLFGNRLLTQVVRPKLLGEFYLLMNLAQWLIIPTMGASVYLVRHWPVALTNRKAGGFARAIGKGLAIQAILAAAAVVVFRYFDLGISSVPGEAMLWLASVALAVQQAFDPVQNMARRRITAGVLAFLALPARSFALALGALVLLSPSAVGLLSVQAVYSGFVALLTVGGFLWLIAPGRAYADIEGPTAPSLSLSGFQSHYIPYLLGSALTQGCVSAERWGLARLADPSSTALFVQAVGLATAIGGAAVGFISTYFYPIIFRSAEGDAPLEAARKPIRRYMLWVGGILPCAVIAVWGLAPVATPLLFGTRFQAVSALLPWAMLGSAFFIMGDTVAVLALAARETVVSNLARWVVQIGYIVALVLAKPSESPALMFCKIYVGKNLLYLAMMVAVGLWLRRREGRGGGSGSDDIAPVAEEAAVGGTLG